LQLVLLLQGHVGNLSSIRAESKTKKEKQSGFLKRGLGGSHTLFPCIIPQHKKKGFLIEAFLFCIHFPPGKTHENELPERLRAGISPKSQIEINLTGVS
jgi:hypothetical protein